MNIFVKDYLKEFAQLLISSILAGLCISIGCIVNLQVGGICGAILFSVGLISVVSFQYKLFTGMAGFVSGWGDNTRLSIILIGNIIGCGIIAHMIGFAIPTLTDKCCELIALRNGVTNGQAFIRSMFCGVLMTIAVKFGKQGNFLPLLFAVPVFILSGFYHCIADSFYILCGGVAPQTYHYLVTIFGNFIGCNLYRLNNII